MQQAPQGGAARAADAYSLRCPAIYSMLAGMGFTTIAAVVSAAASTLPHIVEHSSLRRQANELDRAATQQQRLANKQADALTTTAQQNQQRSARNANEQMGAARVDAAVSNLADDGTARMREVDMATRLQDDITNTANTSLQQAQSIREQGAYTAWNTRNAAARARNQARGALLSGVGSLFGSLASSLSK